MTKKIVNKCQLRRIDKGVKYRFIVCLCSFIKEQTGRKRAERIVKLTSYALLVIVTIC